MNQNKVIPSNLVNIVLNDGVRTERELKEFLTLLAVLNKSATKGYGNKMTDEDMLIYTVKELCINYISKKFPNRCYKNFDLSRKMNIIYIFSSGRQYSFHTYLHLDGIRNAYEHDVKWDNIINSHLLSDEEYRRKVRQKNNNPAKPRTKQADFLEKLEKYKSSKVENERKRKEKERRDFFFQKLDASKWKNRKCVMNRNYDTCISLYAEKMGLPEYTIWKYKSGN